MMCLHKVTKKKDGFLLLFMHNIERVKNEDPKEYPAAILFYNENKGALNIADEMLSSYSIKGLWRRWPLVAFLNLLSISCLDAHVICKDVEIEDAFSFCWEKHCVMPNMKGKNLTYSGYQQQLEIIVLILSFQRKSEHHVATAEKNQETREALKLQGLFLWHIAQDQFLWNVSQKLGTLCGYTMYKKSKTTLCDFYKNEFIYYHVIWKDVKIEDAFSFCWEKHCVMLNKKGKNPT